VEVPEYYQEGDSDGNMFAMRTILNNEEPEHEVQNDLMAATIVFPLKGNKPPKEMKMQKHRLIPYRKKRKRSEYTEQEKRCLATWVEINGPKAWTLWDSGSMTTGVTPAFAEVAQIPVDELEDPYVLQLGMVGSCSTIKYGADVNISVANKELSTYIDIANFDRYEMIIGTPFMVRNNVVLDFDKGKVKS
jgi:hypothetical protein